MALRKAFPKDRQYEFWNILMYFLVHEDKSLPEKDRNLFGSLAYRLISKAAESIPSDPVSIIQQAFVAELTVIGTAAQSWKGDIDARGALPSCSHLSWYWSRVRSSRSATRISQ
jgi:hypothetical protein